MADEDQQQEYQIVTEAGYFQYWTLNIPYRDILKRSRNFTGNGVATYPNNDIYDGHFDNGVINTLTFNSFYRWGMEMERISMLEKVKMRTKIPMLDNGLTILNQG